MLLACAAPRPARSSRFVPDASRRIIRLAGYARYAMFDRLSVIVPCYNEALVVRTAVERLLAAPTAGLKRQVILVDDGSTDGSGRILDALVRQSADREVVALHHPRRMGKGAAIQTALTCATGDVTLIHDADLEYDPADHPRVLAPVAEGRADVVFGTRFAAADERRVIYYWHAVGNRWLTGLTNLLTGLNLTDAMTGCKAFRSSFLRTIPLRTRGFGIELELTCKLAKRGARIYEVPIRYWGRSYEEGKKIRSRHVFGLFATLLRFVIIDDLFEGRYGHSILHDLSKARRFNAYMASAVAGHLGQRVVELGSGIGNAARRYPLCQRLVLTDNDDEYLKILQNQFGDYAHVEVRRLDIDSDDDFAALADVAPDTFVCLNVLEHVEDDAGALQRMADALTPGGRVILVVPQGPWLFSRIDRLLGHHRRYTADGLRQALQSAGLQVERLRHFNKLGVLGWAVNGRLLGRSRFGRIQLKLFNMLAPLVRLSDHLLPTPGLSLLAVARRPKGPTPAASTSAARAAGENADQIAEPSPAGAPAPAATG
jgi:glycosyltransferase involved in cell wall biosynthesis